MAEVKPSEARKNLLKILSVADDGMILKEALKSNVLKNNQKAQGKSIDYSKEGLLKDKDPHTGKPRLTQTEFDALTPEERDNRLGAEHSLRIGRYLTDGINTLASNPDVLRNDEGKYDSKLLKIANSKEIIENSDPKDQEKIMKYASVVRYASIVDDIKNKRPIMNGDDSELVTKVAVAVVQHETLEKILKMGYTRELAEAYSSRAQPSSSEKLGADRLIKGAQRLHEKAKKTFVTEEGEKGEERVAESIGKTLIKMAKSFDNEQERYSIGLYHKAFAGHSLGERSFDEKYKAAA